MMPVSVEDIPRDLSTSRQRVKVGETLVIIRAGQPVAALSAAPGCLQLPFLHRAGCRQ